LVDDNERRIREVYAAWKSAQGIPAGTEHPDDETLACFIEGTLPDAQERKIREHVLACPACGRQVKAHLVTQPPAEDPSAELLEKTRRLLERRLGLYAMELVVRVHDSFLQIVSTTADVLVGQEFVPAVLFRSRQPQDFKDGLTVLKDFQDVRVELRVDKKDNDFSVTAAVKNKETQDVVTGTRISLLKEDIDLESYQAETGKAVFEHVPAGKYSITITSRDDTLAMLFLEITA
jgi:hypothetical protein